MKIDDEQLESIRKRAVKSIDSNYIFTINPSLIAELCYELQEFRQLAKEENK